VSNQKRLDLLPKYFSEKFIGHGTPYVGIGAMNDDSSGNKVVVQEVYKGGPAEGKLMVGDEIIRVYDGEHSWNTYEELRHGGLWGQGIIGTPLTVWVRRDNAEHELHLTRGLCRVSNFLTG
jgi:C-terminal processing protease CtpA/Prc